MSAELIACTATCEMCGRNRCDGKRGHEHFHTCADADTAPCESVPEERPLYQSAP